MAGGLRISGLGDADYDDMLVRFTIDCEVGVQQEKYYWYDFALQRRLSHR